MSNVAHRVSSHDSNDHGEPFVLAPSKWRRWITPQLVRVCDGNVSAALFLAQCCHWDSWKRKQAAMNGEYGDPEGWFYKTTEEWETELALKKRQQHRVRHFLREKKKLLFERHEGSNPPRIYFAVHWKQLQSLLGKQSAGKSQQPDPQGTKRSSRRGQNGPFAGDKTTLSNNEAERLQRDLQRDKTILSMSVTSTPLNVFKTKTKKEEREAGLIVDRNCARIASSIRELNDQFCIRVFGVKKGITDPQLRESIEHYRRLVTDVICEDPDIIDDARRVVARAREKLEAAMDTFIEEQGGQKAAWRKFIEEHGLRRAEIAWTEVMKEGKESA